MRGVLPPTRPGPQRARKCFTREGLLTKINKPEQRYFCKMKNKYQRYRQGGRRHRAEPESNRCALGLRRRLERNVINTPSPGSGGEPGAAAPPAAAVSQGWGRGWDGDGAAAPAHAGARCCPCRSSPGGLGSPSSPGARQHPESRCGAGADFKGSFPVGGCRIPAPSPGTGSRADAGSGSCWARTGRGTSRHAAGPGWDRLLPGATGAEAQRGAPQHPPPTGHRLIRSPNGAGLVAPSAAAGRHGPAEPS